MLVSVLSLFPYFNIYQVNAAVTAVAMWRGYLLFQLLIPYFFNWSFMAAELPFYIHLSDLLLRNNYICPYRL